MRYSPVLFILLAILTACAIHKPESVPVKGSVWLVSQEDVRSAIAVARAGTGFSSGPINSVVVSSRFKLYINFPSRVVVDGHDDPACVVVKKDNGQWRYIGFAEAPVP